MRVKIVFKFYTIKYIMRRTLHHTYVEGIAMALKLFISHSSDDAQTARFLVDLLVRTLPGISGYIRCSSLPDYGFDPGSNLISEIKSDIENSYVVIIATKRGMNSEWVLSEMGAAWALAGHLTVLVGGGLGVHDVRGPYAQTLMINMVDEVGIRRLVRHISKFFKERIPVESFRVLDEELSISSNLFVEEMKSYRLDFPSEKLLYREELNNPEYRLRWGDILIRDTKEVTLVGWSCANVWGAAKGDVWERYLDNGGRVKVLLLDPNVVSVPKFSGDPCLGFGHVCNKSENKYVKDDISKAIDFFLEKSRDFEGKLTIKKTDKIITWSAVGVDLDRSRGYANIEFYSYGDPSALGPDHLQKRLNFIVSYASRYFKNFKNSIDFLWNSASKI